MLENLFGSRTRVKLLKLFLLQEGEFYVREIAKITGEQLNSVRRELENLSKLGLIKEVKLSQSHEQRESGESLDRVAHITPVDKVNQQKGFREGGKSPKFYALDKNFVLYDELKNLFLKSRLLVEKQIINGLDKLGQVKFLVLSGFFVDDKDGKTDILIVGQINKAKLKTLINKISQEFGQEIRYTCMTRQEFNFRNNITDKFLFDVLEGKKIVVVDKL